MKKVIFLVLLVAMFFSCASNPNGKDNNTPVNEDSLEKTEDGSGTTDKIDNDTEKSDSENDFGTTGGSIDNEDSDDNDSESDDSSIDDTNVTNEDVDDTSDSNDIENVILDDEVKDIDSDKDNDGDKTDKKNLEEKVIADELTDLMDLDDTSNNDTGKIDETVVDVEVLDVDSIVNSDDGKSDDKNKDIDKEKTTVKDDNTKNTATVLGTDNSSSIITVDKSTDTDTASDTTTIVESDDESGTEDTNDSREIPKPSRSMTVKKNQLIEVVYPGRGWIYQENIDSEGNIDSRNRNFIFGGRKLGGQNQSFTLRTKKAGKYYLHFYKNDTLTDSYIDDYLEVIVEDENANSSKAILAPDYALTVPPEPVINSENAKSKKKAKDNGKNSTGKTSDKGISTTSAKDNADDTRKTEAEGGISSETNSSNTSGEDSSIKTVVTDGEIATDSASGNSGTATSGTLGTSSDTSDESNIIDISSDEEFVNTNSDNSSITEDVKSAEELLTEAKTQYEAKKYTEALETIKQFLDKAASKIDEGLFLQAQILEAKSEIQNIRSAVEAYDTIIKDYPASKLWDDAKKRSIYLKRFYINIR